MRVLSETRFHSLQIDKSDHRVRNLGIRQGWSPSVLWRTAAFKSQFSTHNSVSPQMNLVRLVDKAESYKLVHNTSSFADQSNVSPLH